MTVFKDKYRTETARLKNWDYSSAGYYFITICTKDRDNLFGEIENSEMILNDFGKIIKEQWRKSFSIRQELQCDEYIIMPNHIHAIIIITENPIPVDARRASQSRKLIEYTIPDKHSSRIHKYRLTEKGKRVMEERKYI